MVQSMLQHWCCNFVDPTMKYNGDWYNGSSERDSIGGRRSMNRSSRSALSSSEESDVSSLSELSSLSSPIIIEAISSGTPFNCFAIKLDSGSFFSMVVEWLMCVEWMQCRNIVRNYVDLVVVELLTSYNTSFAPRRNFCKIKSAWPKIRTHLKEFLQN